MSSRVTFCLLASLLLPSTALADATFFLGSSTTPASRTAKGFAVGAGLLIVAFEFEYANTSEHELDAAPSLRTGMGNLLLQTPVAIGGLQPYFTTGGGLYREKLAAHQETSFGANAGGGVKVSLAGPIRLRFDYRVFTLRGEPLHSRVHRVYAGLNLRF
jgi:hypothetical protein